MIDKTKTRMTWVVRDLSNGNGSDGRHWPTYLWTFATRDAARRAKSQHSSSPELSRFGPIERRRLFMVARRYHVVAADREAIYWCDGAQAPVQES